MIATLKKKIVKTITEKERASEKTSYIFSISESDAKIVITTESELDGIEIGDVIEIRRTERQEKIFSGENDATAETTEE